MWACVRTSHREKINSQQNLLKLNFFCVARKQISQSKNILDIEFSEEEIQMRKKNIFKNINILCHQENVNYNYSGIPYYTSQNSNQEIHICQLLLCIQFKKPSFYKVKLKSRWTHCSILLNLWNQYYPDTKTTEKHDKSESIGLQVFLNIDTKILNKTVADRIEELSKKTMHHERIQGQFDIYKSINVIKFINIFKDLDQIIAVDTEMVFARVQQPFMIKAVKKLETEDTAT